MPHNLQLKKIPTSPKVEFDSPLTMPSPFLPSFSVNANQIKEIREWEAGEKYYLTIEVKMSSKTDDEFGVTGQFDISRYKVIKDKTIDEMSDEEFEIEQGKALAA